MSNEFYTQLMEKLQTNPWDHIQALIFLILITIVVTGYVMYKVSIRLMITYVALKTGVEISKAAGFGKIRDTFTKALNK